MHFMNPVPSMPLVELVRGIGTSDAAADAATALAAHLGKTVIHSVDRPGFIVRGQWFGGGGGGGRKPKMKRKT